METRVFIYMLCHFMIVVFVQTILCNNNNACNSPKTKGLQVYHKGLNS